MSSAPNSHERDPQVSAVWPRATERRSPSGLFRRIYLTFVVAALGAAIVAALGAWFFANQARQRWVGTTLEVLVDEHDALLALLHDTGALEEHADALSEKLDAHVSIYDATGQRLAGDGPAQPRRARRWVARTEHGQPVVQRNAPGHTSVLVPLVEPTRGDTIAIVHVVPDERGRGAPVFVSAVVTLLLLGLGAWSLSRSFTRRIGRLERSAERIARGELSHRVRLDADPPEDEIDELGVAFNQMADRVQSLLVGQQTLLANVSHELRTPIARIKVLLELLEDRLEALRPTVPSGGVAHVDRLHRGLAEMVRDTKEIETLIGDLLTSGRLELRPGDDAGLDTGPVELRTACRRMAERFGATVECPTITIIADEMLLERLLSNLLANARRACPERPVRIGVEVSDRVVTIVVEDEGPGIPAQHRESIFEPFRRLDAARSRDQGGVGLGLYLCRQIARAHGGDVVAQERPDGKPGARMVVTLERTRPVPKATQQRDASGITHPAGASGSQASSRA